jgi:hypothetical protein
VKEHDISLVTVWAFVADKVWDPLRSSPRFDALLEKMNLLEYSRAFRRR